MERLRGAAHSTLNRVSQTPRRQPSSYPFPTTYVILFFSFLSSAITLGIVAYFVYYLRMDSMSVPWQFVVLLFICSVTIISLGLQLYVHTTGAGTAKLLLIGNVGLFVAWIAALAFMSSKLGNMVLDHSCTKKIWITDMGVMVCRQYKAMYSFIVVGTVSIAAQTLLDVSVIREMTKRGSYREMKDKDQVQPNGVHKNSGGLAGRRNVFGLRGGNFVEMKESPDLGSDNGDMGQRLVSQSPDLRFDGQTPDLSYGGHTPDLSEYEKTPRL